MKSFNFMGTNISWFDDVGHVRGHLNSKILKLYAKLLNLMGILNMWIALRVTKEHIKLNVQKIKIKDFTVFCFRQNIQCLNLQKRKETCQQ